MEHTKQTVYLSATHPRHKGLVWVTTNDLTAFVQAGPDAPVFITNTDGAALGQVRKSELDYLLVQHTEQE